MPRYARVVDGVVIETIDLPDDILPDEAFVAKIAAQLVACDPEVEQRWVRHPVAGFAPPPPPPPPDADQLLAYAAARRWAVETAGIAATIGGESVPLSTARGDDRTALHITFSAIMFGLRADGAAFKFADGISRPASNAEMGSAIAAAFAHVQAAFDTGGTVAAAIAAGTITTFAEIDAAFA